MVTKSLLVLFAYYEQLLMNYSRHMKSIWEYILNSDPEIMRKMDRSSVQVLELLCPKISDSDARTVNQSLIGISLNEQQQALVKRRAFEIDTLIPSFRSSFEDLNYLELLVNALKKLHRPKKSEYSFYCSLQCINTNPQAADRAWRKLFLYSMRNHYRIHAPPVRDSSLKAGEPDDLNRRISEVNEAQLHHFARYAFYLGFRNIWKPSLPLPADEKGYDVRERRRPNLVTYEWEAGVKEERRSGPPRRRSHKECRAFLWIENMEAPNEGHSRGITHFFVRKEVYRAFFDPWKPPYGGKLASTRIVQH